MECSPEILLNLSNSEIQNMTNSSVILIDKLQSLHMIAYYNLLPILLATGIATNVLNISCLWNLGRNQVKAKQVSAKTIYIYLTWLSIGQLMSCISCIPSIIHLDRKTLTYTWAFYYAHFEIMTQNYLTSCCVYIILGMSVDRFKAVCRPNDYNAVNRLQLAKLWVILSFLLPLILYTPHTIALQPLCNAYGTGWTTTSSELTKHILWHIWTILVELFHRFFPMIMVAYLNIRIIIEFRKVTKIRQLTRIGGASESRTTLSKSKSKNKIKAQERCLVNLLLAVTLTFILTTFPSALLALTDELEHEFTSFGFEVSLNNINATAFNIYHFNHI